MTAHATHTGGTSAGYSRWLLTCASHFHAVGACEGVRGGAELAARARRRFRLVHAEVLALLRAVQHALVLDDERALAPARARVDGGGHGGDHALHLPPRVGGHPTRGIAADRDRVQAEAAAIPGLPRSGDWTSRLAVDGRAPTRASTPCRAMTRGRQRGASATIRAPRDPPATPAGPVRAPPRANAAPPPHRARAESRDTRAAAATRDARRLSTHPPWRAERMGEAPRREDERDGRDRNSPSLSVRCACFVGHTDVFVVFYIAAAGPSPNPPPVVCFLRDESIHASFLDSTPLRNLTASCRTAPARAPFEGRPCAGAGARRGGGRRRARR